MKQEMFLMMGMKFKITRHYKERFLERAKFTPPEWTSYLEKSFLRSWRLLPTKAASAWKRLEHGVQETAYIADYTQKLVHVISRHRSDPSIWALRTVYSIPKGGEGFEIDRSAIYFFGGDIYDPNSTVA